MGARMVDECLLREGQFACDLPRPYMQLHFSSFGDKQTQAQLEEVLSALETTRQTVSAKQLFECVLTTGDEAEDRDRFRGGAGKLVAKVEEVGRLRREITSAEGPIDVA